MVLNKRRKKGLAHINKQGFLIFRKNPKEKPVIRASEIAHE